MNNWTECFVQDIAAQHKHAMSTGPFGSAISSKYFVDDGVPVIRGGNLSPNVGVRIKDEGLVFVTEEKAVEFHRSIVKHGDIVFTCWGTINQIGLIDDNTKYKRYVISNKQMKLTVDSDAADYRFIYYLFSSPDKQSEILNNGIGAAVPGFNLGQLKKMTLRLPQLPEQKAIADVLSSLDDKIDLLHRQNQTFQAIGETLFRQWFVEEANDDWEEGTLADVATNIRHSVNAKEIDPNSKYVGLEHVSRRSFGLTQSGLGGSITSNKSAFDVNDILFGKLRPYFHKVCFAPFNGICSTDILVIRAINANLFAYCLFAFFQDDVVNYANQGAGGTRMPRTNWTSLSGYPISIPPTTHIDEFNSVVMPGLRKISQNLQSIQTLEQLRDTLLPKLMSGEVTVI